MKATFFSAAALAALPSLGAAQLLNLAAASSAPQVTTGYSTTTSTRTVLHVITETHFSSTELETSTELIPVVTPTPVNIQVAVATPVSSFPTLSVVANSTQGINSTLSKVTQTAGATGAVNVAAVASGSGASPTPTGGSSALQISGGAVAAIAAAAGFFVL